LWALECLWAIEWACGATVLGGLSALEWAATVLGGLIGLASYIVIYTLYGVLVYTLWGPKRFLLPITYLPMNLVTLRVTGIWFLYGLQYHSIASA